MTGGLDVTATYVAHDALRRDLEILGRIAARVDRDPRDVLRAAAGWPLFKAALHRHQTAEDEALWPAVRRAAAGRPEVVDLLTALGDEHRIIGALVDGIDAAIGDGSGPEALRDLVEVLVVELGGHLKHEEIEALPVVHEVLDEEQWQHFVRVQARLALLDLPHRWAPALRADRVRAAT